MAIELKNRIDLTLNVTVAVMDLLQGLTIAEISARILEQLRAPAPVEVHPVEVANAEELLRDADPSC